MKELIEQYKERVEDLKEQLKPESYSFYGDPEGWAAASREVDVLEEIIEELEGIVNRSGKNVNQYK